MLNMKMKNMVRSCSCKILGIELIREVKAVCRLSFLEISLIGLRIRKARITRIADKAL